jgi:signal transduction histidine kinase
MVDIDSLLSRDSYVAIYRTVQEALTNIGKHSQARSVSVDIRKDESKILFSIADDGVGFDLKGPEEMGLGLATMRGRAQMLGGALDIQALDGRGTRITLTIPIQRGATA